MADGEAAVASLRDRLLKERHALLDLSTRNRLLNTPLRTRNNRAIEIVDEKSAEVFRLLTSGKTMTFLPGIQLSEEERAELDPEDTITGGIPQPEEEAFDERGIAVRHVDLRLQTKLTSEGLQKRLFDIWYDARTLEEEQGVNILYLAIGLLKWFDSDSSDIARHAPLILLPVKLERGTAADKFKLKWREEPPSPNFTLQAKMAAEFALTIDDFSDEDEVNLVSYFAQVADTISAKKRWEVLPDAMVLGFFSFSKFLMYRDLDPDNWPSESGIDSHPMIRALLRDGFPESPPLIPDGAAIDDVIPPLELHHVVDADSSQTVAIAEAASGRTLVVKGPPGTGKSQTITNIIAAAVARGKKVLFVAEKMAALEVVHRRLRQVGLGPLTLELHSNKANKRAILEELKRTRDGQPRPPRGDLSVIQKLGDTSGKLNAFARQLHKRLEPCGLTPQAILGLLARVHHTEAPTGFTLSGAENWNQEGVKQRKALAQEVAERVRDLGPVPQHSWRGVRRGALDPVERSAIAARINHIGDLLAQARRHALSAVDLLGAPAPQSIGDLEHCFAVLSVSPPPAELDRRALTAAAWKEQGETGLRQLINAGRIYAASWSEAEACFNEAGQQADYREIRVAVVTKGTSLFRFLDGGYRAQISLLRSYLCVPLPKRQAERIALIDSMVAAQRAKEAFFEAARAGEAFGITWKAERSDWDVLENILEWRVRHDALPYEVWARLAKLDDMEGVEVARQRLAKLLPELRVEVEQGIKELDLDLKRAFGATEISDIGLADLENRLIAWRNDPEGLSHFIAFALRARELAQLGLQSLVDGIHDGLIDHRSLLPAFEAAYAEVLRQLLFRMWPELKAFDGESHNNLVSLFRQLDRARIELAQEQIMAAHADGRPRGGSGIGPLGFLNSEIARKRGHAPVRVLLDKAGPAIQQLKPVFMMSPLSVAQFLKPGGLTFDLLVMDEASQIEPVDALGAVARVNQLVVVGDERQLPPTAFFKKLTGDEDSQDGDDGAAAAKDMESILELCLAKGAPYRMLSWHYRSKHQSLIAVSNREFYENKLFIVPSPYDAIAGMGLKFNLLKNAPYDRGGTRTNPQEAKVVAQAVIDHARAHPDRSLGVATFSVAQRQLILKELELLRRANPDVEGFFQASGAEPFFVKNLENIQGDERDVIFISIGYGKTEQGYLAHAFGPLSAEGGERRLNVLISRAKMRCEVFCNFTGADLDLERARARGVAALKLFLTFAETGNFGLGEASGEDFDSEFEAQVCERLRALGYDVKPQIGASGFRVDLAVSDPEKPGRFVLGIECDGAQYHSSRSARDRDRLRQEVLEAHGWIIHRIWSADWYLRPQQELKKVEDAIAYAKGVWRDRDEEGIQTARAVPVSFEAETIGETDVVSAFVEDAPAIFSGPERVFYSEASFPVVTALDPHETPVADMAGHVVTIVEMEGPVHIDEITQRIRTLWGLGRAGSRIRTAVARAADLARRRGLIEGEEFFKIPGKAVIVRDRSRASSSTLRKPEMLPPAEIEEALFRIIDENFGASRDELVQALSRAFGYLATSAQLRARITTEVGRLVGCNALSEKDGLLVRV